MSEIITVNGKEYINGTKYTLKNNGTFVCEDGEVLYYVCGADEKDIMERKF